MEPKRCYVTIRGRDGGIYATNVLAAMPREAADLAVEFFFDPFWKGPKPKRDTVLQVAPMGIDKTFAVWAFPRDGSLLLTVGLIPNRHA